MILNRKCTFWEWYRSLSHLKNWLRIERKLAKFPDEIGRALCLSIRGFGWKPTATTGILKAQSQTN